MQTALLIAGTTLAFCAAAVLMVLAYLALKLLGEISLEAFRPAAQIGPGHTPARPLPRPAARLTTITIGGIERCADCGLILSMVPGRISDPVLAWPEFQHPCLGCPTCAAREASSQLPDRDEVGQPFQCPSCGYDLRIDVTRFNDEAPRYLSIGEANCPMCKVQGKAA